MLKTLRSNTKTIIIIVIVFFVGMIVLGWGMDINRSRSGKQTRDICEINGEKLSVDLYRNRLQYRRQAMGNRSRSNFATERMLHAEVWNELVNEVIISQEIKKRKISYTDRELLSYILNNPSQIVFQVPFFQEDGRFSFSRYQGFVQNPENYKNPQTAELLQFIENQAKGTLPFLKFQDKITRGVLVSDNTVRERWNQENEKRTIQWFFLSPFRFSDVARSPEQKDIEAYYNEHKEEYEQKELRVLDMVLFPLQTTARDSADIFDRAQMLARRAKSGEDFAGLANGYSEDPGNDDGMGNPRGGDLGYFGRGMMVKEFEDVAFSLKPGEIAEPFLSQFGYHIVKVDSVKFKEDDSGKPGKEIDRIKARHILLKIGPSPDTREAMKNRADSFYEETVNGKDFALLAKDYELEVAHNPPIDEDAIFISLIGPNTEILVKRVFFAKQGDILQVYYSDQGAFVIRVSEVIKAGIPPLEEIITQVTDDFRKEQRMAYAEEVVARIYQRYQSGMSLQEAVDADSSTVINVSSETVTLAQSISGLGSRNPLIASAFGLENKGDSTGPVATELGVGLAVLEEKFPVDEEKYENEREQLRDRIKQELQNEILKRVVESLREKAKIVDNRHFFYN